MQQIANFTLAELARFKQVQALAYEAVQTVEQQLHEGMTEKQAAQMIADYLEEREVDSFFHKPFAWFGPRTAFTNFWSAFHFFPTDKKLTKGLPVILDVAPTIGGYTADIGYSFTFKGESPVMEKMKETLAIIRKHILQKVKEGTDFADIYRSVDDIIAENGFRNAHQVYPRRVLGHRVTKTKTTFYDRFSFGGFSLRQTQWLLPELVNVLTKRDRGQSALWNDLPESQHAPIPGTWAVEPHLASMDGQVGAKFEEILVITENDAYWLDDTVPHVLASRGKGLASVAA